MRRLGGRTVTAINRVPSGQKDRYGNDVLTDVQVPVRVYSVQPAATSEDEADNAQQTTADLVIFAPLAAPISGATSAVIPYADKPTWRYEVQGDPERWESSTGRTGLEHLRIFLRKVEG